MTRLARAWLRWQMRRQWIRGYRAEMRKVRPWPDLPTP